MLCLWIFSAKNQTSEKQIHLLNIDSTKDIKLS